MSETDQILPKLRQLYDRCLYLQAHALAQQSGLYSREESTETRIFASRLVGKLGAGRQSTAMQYVNWRADRKDPEAAFFYAAALLSRGRVWAAWQFCSTYDFPDSASNEHRAHWFSLISAIASCYRDFSAAEQWQANAEQSAPEDKWVQICRGSLSLQQDQYQQALEQLDIVLSTSPEYGPAIIRRSSVLAVLDRKEEALAFLDANVSGKESYELLIQQLQLQISLERYEEALQTIDQAERTSVLADADLKKCYSAFRYKAQYHLGKYSEAITFAKKADDEYYNYVAEQLSQNSQGKHVLLDVPFVRQHHMTCAPATISAICQYFGYSVDHLEIAEEICYGGTLEDEQRAWAIANGWHAREFRLTAETAFELIDRGIPFTLNTVDPGSAHQQAVIGYDSRRGLLLIRDPYFIEVQEFLLDRSLERYRSCGPRAMIVVPQDQASRISDLVLPDEQMYDELFTLKRALKQFSREEAWAAYEQLLKASPEHRLTHFARLYLAQYDEDVCAALDEVRALHLKYPEDVGMLLRLVWLLRDRAGREEWMGLLKEYADGEYQHPVVWCSYADELLADAADYNTARFYLQRAIKFDPLRGGTNFSYASLLWSYGDREKACELFRFAMQLEPTNEHYARSYFEASRFIGKGQDALSFLEKRAEQTIHKSSGPTITLAQVYDSLDRSASSIEIIEQAIAKLPEDGVLALEAVVLSARYGKFDKAGEYLAQASGRTTNEQQLRVVAWLADCQGNLEEALEAWLKLLQFIPLDMEAHVSVARHLAALRGENEAIAHIAEASTRFPHHQGLYQLHYSWLVRENPEAAEQVARQVIRLFPNNTWAFQSLALLLAEKAEFDEAYQLLEHTKRIEPDGSAYLNSLGRLHCKAGKHQEAAELFRLAIEKNIDDESAIHHLLSLTVTPEEAKQELAHIWQQMNSQVLHGEGLLAFREFARGVVEPEKLVEALQSVLKRRPDLWQAWSALAMQHLEMNNLEAACHYAKTATEKFPLLPRVWLDLVTVYRFTNDTEAERTALEQALQISPNWSIALHSLAEFHCIRGEFEKAQAALARAISVDPLEPSNHVRMATILWNLGTRQEAFEQLFQALRYEPNNEEAWNYLEAWADLLGQRDRVVEFAGEVVRRHPRNPNAWHNYGTLLSPVEHLDQKLAAFDKAIEFAPRWVLAHHTKALLLQQLGRIEEAVEVCRDRRWNGAIPTELRVREALIDLERGSVEQALTALAAIVESDPGNSWASSCLAEVYADYAPLEQYHAAALRLVELSPHVAQSYGYLGDALCKLTRSGEAIPKFEKALQLDPTYVFALHSLVKLYVSAKRFSDAQQAVVHCEPHVSLALSSFVKTLIASGQGDISSAVNEAQVLIFSEEFEGWQLFELMESCCATPDGFTKFRSFLDTQLENDLAPTAVGIAWAELGREVDCAELAARLVQLPLERPAVEEACSHLLGIYADHSFKQGTEVLVAQLGQRLRTSNSLWAMTGYALRHCEMNRQAVEWMSDWKQRSEIQPWMLVAFSQSLRSTGDDHAAYQMIHAALQMEPDHTYHIQLLNLAMSDLFFGNIDGVRSAMEQLHPSQFENTTWRGHFFLLDSLLIVLEQRGRLLPNQLQNFLERTKLLYEQFPFLANDINFRRLHETWARCLVAAGITEFRAHYREQFGFLASLKLSFTRNQSEAFMRSLQEEQQTRA